MRGRAGRAAGPAAAALALLAALLPALPALPALGAPSPEPRPPAPAPVPAPGRVVRVLDGDSLLVEAGASRIEVRLHGIDCPERTQPYSARARRLTRELAHGREVRLVTHGTDAYGRTLAEVLLPDGRSLNRELVRAGFAWWYRRYVPGDVGLERLELEARAARRGLWADPAPVAPWDFREAQRAAQP